MIVPHPPVAHGEAYETGMYAGRLKQLNQLHQLPTGLNVQCDLGRITVTG